MDSKCEINHTSIVVEDISGLFLSERHSDVTFIVDGKHIFAHKVMLAARSPVFRDMMFESTPLVGCKRQIHINDCSALSFKNFIKYLYSGKLSLFGVDEMERQELLALALKYEMKPLVESILEPSLNTVLSPAPTQQTSVGTSSEKPQMKEELVKDNNKPKPNTITNPLQFEDKANVKNGAVVVQGINPERLFSGKKDLDEKSLTKHKIELNTQGLLIKLNVPANLNLVKFRLLDIEPKRYYSYYVMVSNNGTASQWTTVADYRVYSCRSWQTIFFDQRLVQFIRIVGTNSNEKLLFSNTRYFTIISFYCGLTKRPPNMFNGFWEPEANIASLGRGSIVVINNGNDYCRTAKMINDYIEFEYKKYNNICSEFSFDANSELIIHLPQPIVTTSISFYISGEQKFKYTVKISIDPIDKENKKWTVVADNRKQFNAPKWQKITFNKMYVLLIAIANIRCLDESVNTFPVLSFTCP